MEKVKKNLDVQHQVFALWLMQIQKQDDKSMVITGTSMIESKFIELFKLKMKNTGNTFNKLFNPGGSLESLFSMSGLSYCLGYISKGAYQDILKISRIRNVFAHNWEVNSLEHQKIKKDDLRFYMDQEGVNFRDQFIRVVMLIVGALDLKSK